MLRKVLIAALGVVAMSFSVPVAAAVLVFQTTLLGANENPPAASPGSGFGVVTLDTIANTMRVQATFANLLGTTTASHIHCCTANPLANAGVATTTPTFPGFPLGVTAGNYDQLFDMTLATSFNGAFVTANGGNVTSARTALFNGIIAGEAYLNVHSSRFPGGEIRGQLTAVPEASTWAMMLVGFAGLGAAMRRRRSVFAIA
jgi:CHRD domain/PEP-CTERM motif